MRKYEVVEVALEQEKLGYAVLDTETGQFQGLHLYVQAERGTVLMRRQELEDTWKLRTNWPDARDPAVLELIADRNFEVTDLNDGFSGVLGSSITRLHKACEKIAKERAGF